MKLIACLLMLCDHIGAVVYPSQEWLRWIGRLSMPIFAYMLARGFDVTEKHGTGDRYLKSLLILSVVSQLPYLLICPSAVSQWNIALTWATSYLVLKLLALYRGRPFLCTCLLLILGISIACGTMEYSFLAIGYAVCFYYTLVRKDRPLLRYFIGCLLTTAYCILYMKPVQSVGLLAFPLIDLMIRAEQARPSLSLRRVPKAVWYAFYPVHMLCVCIIPFLQK